MIQYRRSIQSSHENIDGILHLQYIATSFVYLAIFSVVRPLGKGVKAQFCRYYLIKFCSKESKQYALG